MARTLGLPAKAGRPWRIGRGQGFAIGLRKAGQSRRNFSTFIWFESFVRRAACFRQADHCGPATGQLRVWWRDNRSLSPPRRRRAAATCRGRKGEASDERGESVPPDPRLLARRHLPAQFDRREPLAERMKLTRSVPHRATAEQADRLDPGHPRLEADESLRSSGSEIPCQLWRAHRLLDADPEQRRVSDGETPEY